MSNIIFLDDADRAAFLTLPQSQRDRANLLAPFMHSLELRAQTSRSVAAPLRALRSAYPMVALQFRPSTLLHLFAKWRSEGRDWRALVDRRRLPFV